MTARRASIASALLAIGLLTGLGAGCGGGTDGEADERVELAVQSAELAVATGDAIRTATTAPGPESREAAAELREHAGRAEELGERASELGDSVGAAIAEFNAHTRDAAGTVSASLEVPGTALADALLEASRAYSRGQSALRSVEAALGDRVDERQESRLERARIEARNSRDQLPVLATARLEQTPPAGGEPDGDGGGGYIAEPNEVPLAELDP